MRGTLLKSLEVAEKMERGRNFRRRFVSLSVKRYQRRVLSRVTDPGWRVDNIEAERGLQTLRRLSIVSLWNKFKDERPTSVGVYDLIVRVVWDLTE